MKIGDIVTRRMAGDEAQFCVVGFYTNQDSGDQVAIVAMLDPLAVMEISVRDLTPVSLKDIISLATHTSFFH